HFPRARSLAGPQAVKLPTAAECQNRGFARQFDRFWPSRTSSLGSLLEVSAPKTLAFAGFSPLKLPNKFFRRGGKCPPRWLFFENFGRSIQLQVDAWRMFDSRIGIALFRNDIPNSIT